MATRPVDAPLGDGTAEHAARGVGPSQDYKCGIGTPIVAPFDVVRTVRSGTVSSLGGLTLTGYARNGDYWVMQHLSRWLDGDRASEGDVVALSGNTGTWTTGPHLHHYVVLGGKRCNPEDIGLYAEPAGLDPKPFTPPETKKKRKTMDFIIYVGTGDLEKRQWKLEGGKFRLIKPTERSAIDKAAKAVGEVVQIVEITIAAISKQGTIQETA